MPWLFPKKPKLASLDLTVMIEPTRIEPGTRKRTRPSEADTLNELADLAAHGEKMCVL